MNSLILPIAHGAICIAGLLSIVRVAIGPTLVDRATGLEVFTLSGMAFIALHGMQTQHALVYDMLILWSLLAFVATSALGMYLYRRNLE